jgi:hypothetical protein
MLLDGVSGQCHSVNLGLGASATVTRSLNIRACTFISFVLNMILKKLYSAQYCVCVCIFLHIYVFFKFRLRNIDVGKSREVTL